MSIAGPGSFVHLDTDLTLSQIGDAEGARTILVMLEETLQRDIHQISALLDQADVVGANRLLHPLKGFIPIFCGPVLSGRVSDVEGLSKNGGPDDVKKAYADLRPELETLLAEVSSHLSSLG
jgi:hypothetical protein